jgi:hypothetical protein
MSGEHAKKELATREKLESSRKKHEFKISSKQAKNIQWQAQGGQGKIR